MAQPPMKCAVSGVLKGSPTAPPGMPPMMPAMSAHRLVGHRDPGRVGLAVALLAGHSRPVSRTRLVNVVIELSTVCITSAMTVRSDQCLRS